MNTTAVIPASKLKIHIIYQPVLKPVLQNIFHPGIPQKFLPTHAQICLRSLGSLGHSTLMGVRNVAAGLFLGSQPWLESRWSSGLHLGLWGHQRREVWSTGRECDILGLDSPAGHLAHTTDMLQVPKMWACALCTCTRSLLMLVWMKDACMDQCLGGFILKDERGSVGRGLSDAYQVFEGDTPCSRWAVS